MVAIRSSAGTAAEDVWGQVVDLLAVFVANDRPASCARISSEGNAILSHLACRFVDLH
jgi:hypothetical protein